MVLRIAAMTALASMLILSAVEADDQMILDDFDYESVEAAQAAWLPAEESVPVGLMEHEDSGMALRLNADFTGDAGRAVYDRDVDFDLSTWGRFTMQIFIDDPGLFGRFTIYFRSGEGWYGAGLPLRGRGWTTADFSRADFGQEGDPAGWNQIDGIRLSAWRGAPETGFCAVDNLMAHRESRCVVMGTNTIEAGGGEAGTVRDCAARVGQMLEDAGVRTSTIGDNDVEDGLLESFEFAFFAYNPDMSEAEVEAIRQFVADGGRIMVCYSLAEGLDEVLGVTDLGHTPGAYDGQFADIRFTDVDDFQGMPDEVGQGSWNITAVEPIEGEGRVIGEWYDTEGRATGYPAMTASEAGVFMTHIVTGSDAAAKRQMLVSILGHYLPDVWPQVAQQALAGPEQIGHFMDAAQAREWIEAQIDSAPDPDVARAALEHHDDSLQAARDLIEEGRFADEVAMANEGWTALGDAYGLVHPPRDAEFRAWWNHSGTGAYDTWEESMRQLHEAGFNAIVPNMWWGGVALYDSEYLPHHPVVEERGDQIAECVEAAKRYGIEVHPWKVNWNLGGGRAPDWFVNQLRDEGRLQQSFDGEEIGWLCPSDDRNFELELNTMVEVALNYDVDGVHFDYIRYPGSQGCFCERCHRKFEEATGLTIDNWPEAVREDEEIAEAWTQFRCDNISRLVEATAERVREVKPDCKISAAVFGSYPGCRRSIGQDWVYWIEQGWLDFVCPMDYTTSHLSFASLVSNQVQQVAGRVPLYPGIGAWRLNEADGVIAQAHIARNVGADGFILFNYGRELAETISPVMGEALLSRPAIMPHNAPVFDFELGELTRERTYGLHVEPGATVTATVARGEDIAGRAFEDLQGMIVLQDLAGRTVEELAEAPTDGEVEVTFSAESGLHRLAVVGSYEGEDEREGFTTRSLPIVFGEIAEDVQPLL